MIERIFTRIRGRIKKQLITRQETAKNSKSKTKILSLEVQLQETQKKIFGTKTRSEEI